MRTLATIQRIRELAPIPEADAIQRATVLGWQLVVKKGEFQVGDLAVYCEIDSLLPDRPEFEFLRPRGMRIRTVRLRGQVSQGICFPLSFLPPGTPHEEGLDVTEILGVTLYEPPIPASLAGEAKGFFPGFIPKTDETRVQVLQEVLDQYVGTPCYITEKLDGTSATFFVKDGTFGVCSRNLELLDTPGSAHWQVAKEMDIEAKLRSLGGNFSLQGELVGEGIQGNKYKLKGKTVFFFNLFDISAYQYLNFVDFTSTLDRLGLPMVPILDTDYALSNDIDTLVRLSVGKSALYAVEREGIVIRPLEEKTSSVGRVSFKSISPEFLLKYE